MIIKPISISGNDYSELINIDESKSGFNEDWLQKVLHDNPQTYPIENPLNRDLKIISLGREINSGSGYIDILLLTSEAELIIVETKLWRNPEKSRTVLAQVIDYAKELSHWGYDDLNDAVIAAQRNQKLNKTLSLRKIIETKFSNQNQTDFIDILTQNLQQGLLKLSIIGDKISPNLLLLSDTIQGSPGLNFTLSLIEMKLFKYNEDIILIPDIVGKTKEVIRGVVKVQYEQEKPKVDIKYLNSEKSHKSKTKTDRETFLSQCPEDVAPILETYLDDWQNNPALMIYWGVTGLSIRKQLDDKWTTLIDIYPDCISMIIPTMAENNQIPKEIYDEYLEVLFNIDGLKSAYSSKKRYIKYNSMSTEDIEMMLEAVGKLANKLIDN